MRTSLAFLPGLVLGLTLACGGSVSQVTPKTPVVLATGLVYTAPAGTGWRLVEDAASTPTRLLLDLIGPAGTASRGVGFNVQGPAGVKFGAFQASGGMPIADAGVYEMLSAYPTTYPYEPSMLGGGVKPGNLLTVGIFQKDRRLSAKDSGAPLCQIALEVDPAANLATGTALPLSVPKARFIPGDIGPTTLTLTAAEYLEAQTKGHLVPMTVAVGTLAAQ